MVYGGGTTNLSRQSKFYKIYVLILWFCGSGTSQRSIVI
jgi:hypothetical protein